MFLQDLVFLFGGLKAAFPVGMCMFSCMNRIFGSEWVDNTITTSDLLASSLQLGCTVQICPVITKKNISKQYIITII